MNINWLSNWTPALGALGARLAAAALRPGHFGEAWDHDADHRRAMSDLDAIRVRFPDHA